MKKYLLATIVSLAFLTLPVSFALPKKTKKCPSVTALKDSHFNFTTRQKDEGWIVADLKNNYETNENWTFLMFDINGQNETKAIMTARNEVKNLTFLNGPIFYSEKQRWACIYQTAQSNYSVSYTPTIPPGEIN